MSCILYSTSALFYFFVRLCRLEHDSGGGGDAGGEQLLHHLRDCAPLHVPQPHAGADHRQCEYIMIGTEQ